MIKEDKTQGYIGKYLEEAKEILDRIDPNQITGLLSCLRDIRSRKGRLFFLGVGGGAANASHAVNDFRKICGFESYSPLDNVSEMSARINDEGWESIFVRWLEQSRLTANDGLFIFSVGGGDRERNISANLVWAITYAKKVGARVMGVVGRKGGYTALNADACVLIPEVNAATITPHTETFQALILHLLVSHPDMKKSEMKWESQK